MTTICPDILKRSQDIASSILEGLNYVQHEGSRFTDQQALLYVSFLCLFTSKRLWSNKLCIWSTEICIIIWYFTTSSYSSLPIKRHDTVVYRVLFFHFSRIQCGMIYLFLQLAKSQHSMFQSKMTSIQLFAIPMRAFNFYCSLRYHT